MIPSATSPVLASSIEELGRIRDRGVNLVIRPRPSPPWCAALAHSLEQPFDVRVRGDDFSALVEPLHHAAPNYVGALLEDMKELAQLCDRLLGDRPRTVGLAVVVDDSCRKFHVDRRDVRLLCTYVGPGTEWVPNGAGNRAALASDAPDVETANRAIVPDQRAIRRMLTGWVGLLRGESCESNAGNGVVHRSPPIAGSSST
ncbi:MAG: DUF1826 domain-containing protein [Polyangiales bacterium]